MVSHSVIGPNTSIDEGAVIQGSTIKDSIIATGVKVTNSKLETSLLGHDVTVTGLSGKFNLGDDSTASI
jgi:glucose-1-phosphate thymidylyltransferase